MRACNLLFLLACLGRAVPAAFAQGSQTLGVVTCSATSVPPVVRAEGIAELVGDIVIACVNVPPPGNHGPSVNSLFINVSVSLNVTITNNINFSGYTTAGDAVLIVNESNCSSPANAGSTFGSCAATDERFQDPQFGWLAANNRLEWNYVTFPIPGAAEGQSPVLDCSEGGGAFLSKPHCG